MIYCDDCEKNWSIEDICEMPFDNQMLVMLDLCPVCGSCRTEG